MDRSCVNASGVVQGRKTKRFGPQLWVWQCRSMTSSTSPPRCGGAPLRQELHLRPSLGCEAKPPASTRIERILQGCEWHQHSRQVAPATLPSLGRLCVMRCQRDSFGRNTTMRGRLRRRATRRRRRQRRHQPAPTGNCRVVESLRHLSCLPCWGRPCHLKLPPDPAPHAGGLTHRTRVLASTGPIAGLCCTAAVHTD